MRPCRPVAALVLAALIAMPARSATAQETDQDSLPTRPEELDYDSLAACSVIYGQVGEIYQGRGQGGKALEFTEAGTAYAATGLHVLGYRTQDPESATRYADDRMEVVVDALNAASKSNPDGDMGVIENWMPYCDSIGPVVTRALGARQRRGW